MRRELGRYRRADRRAPALGELRVQLLALAGQGAVA
jgi:hypothetical protein